MTTEHDHNDMNAKKETPCERREFLRTCGCALAGIAIAGIAPLVSGCEFTHINSAGETPGTGNGRTVEIDVSAITADGTGLMTDVRGPDRKRIFVARFASGTFKAMSTQCTHSQFPLAYDGTGLYCTGGQGHDSRFNLKGEPQSGPAVPFGPVQVYPSVYDAARKVLVVTVGT
ncbi:MAG TPA: Rieske 2Fe-2S domain-containing protein [Candidatus Kapabacteria bacterium]|jgi:nitrite reductase/ring-hydroxylating ferredoxin subunit|nr:Rieske 2Fe-2S domain-containing protein [Candidatus Kapabacteria bacterium]